MTACIVGWAHTSFGKLEGETVESLIVRVVTEALADAGIAARDVDEMVLGHFNAGFSGQDFTAALMLQAEPGNYAIVVTGPVGWNLGAGMTGGQAFVFDSDAERLISRLNPDLVDAVRPDAAAQEEVRWLVERHAALTG